MLQRSLPIQLAHHVGAGSLVWLLVHLVRSWVRRTPASWVTLAGGDARDRSDWVAFDTGVAEVDDYFRLRLAHPAFVPVLQRAFAELTAAGPFDWKDRFGDRVRHGKPVAAAAPGIHLVVGSSRALYWPHHWDRHTSAQENLTLNALPDLANALTELYAAIDRALESCFRDRPIPVSSRRTSLDDPLPMEDEAAAARPEANGELRAFALAAVARAVLFVAVSVGIGFVGYGVASLVSPALIESALDGPNAPRDHSPATSG